VRTDYLKTSLRLLCLSPPSQHTFFYKALPINVAKWVEALCVYDIDTYTPRSWSMKHAEPCQQRISTTFAELSVFNETPEYVDFFGMLKHRLKQAGVSAREFDTREDFEASLCFLREQNPKNTFGCTVLAGDRLAIKLDGDSSSPSPGTARPLVPAKPTRRLRPLVLRPSDDDLAVEDVLGIIVRGGGLVGVGSGTTLLALYARDCEGTLLKSFTDETFVWKQIADRTSGVVHSLWVMNAAARGDGGPVPTDVRTAGMDVPLTLVPGVSALELANTRLASPKRFVKICEAVAGAVASQLREAVHRRIVSSPLRAQGSDLVYQITMDLKDRAKPRATPLGRAQAAPLPDGEGVLAVPLIMPAEKAVPAFNIPKLCRNAWITADGGRVEVVDGLQRDVLLGRTRLYGAKRCPGCPADHPDHIRTERIRCSAPLCSSKFLFYTTTTHYVFKKASGRSLEVDINMPLFSDDALSSLRLNK
jgi:hypothetical protein